MGTYYSNRNDVIESDDITDILGIHVAEENGAKVATIKVCLDPVKDWLAVKQFFLHLTNGINHRTVGPVPAAEHPSALLTTPEPATVPASDSAPTTTPSTEGTAGVVSTTDTTVKTSAVTPPAKGEKGN